MKVVLIVGATGQQGSSVIRALTDSEDYSCLALTRSPESYKAQKLKSLKNLTLVSGDLNEIEQLRTIFEDAKAAPTGAIWGVFVALEHPGLGANAEGEERQGKNIATVAQEFRVQSYIYSSTAMLPFPDDKPPIPGTSHYSKVSIEKHVSSMDVPWTIIRPGFIMENFNSSIAGRFTNAAVQYCMPPESKLQLTALDDIGRFSRLIFDGPHKFDGKTIDIATAGLTPQECSQIFVQATGCDIPSVPRFVMSVIYWLNQDVRNMIGSFVQSDDLRRLDPKGYDANVQEAASHMKLTSFETWARNLNQKDEREVNDHRVTLWGLITRRT
ncbi:hypothetical protein OPQ81_007498 [Rhizoctonia solani]|nr:hypothetical protein OPQ81_007498 [Rhizoctonia solani]